MTAYTVLQQVSSLCLAPRKQVDGIAFCPGSSPGSWLLTVAASSLTGNTWDGALAVVDLSVGGDSEPKALSHVTLQCGVADLCWAGRGSAIVTADDNGDAKVRRWPAASDQSTVANPDVATCAHEAYLICDHDACMFHEQIYQMKQSEAGGAVEVTPVAVLAEHHDMLSCVAAADAGGMIVTGSWDTTIKLWDAAAAGMTSTAEDSAAKPCCTATLTGHCSRITAIACAAAAGSSAETSDSSSSSNTIASASADGTVRLWDARSAACTAQCTPRSSSTSSTQHSTGSTAAVPLALAWHPHESSVLAVGCEDGAAELLDVRNLSAGSVSQTHVNFARVARLAFRPSSGHKNNNSESSSSSSSSALLAVAGDDGSVTVLNVTQGCTSISLHSRANKAHADYTRALAWHPAHQSTLISGGWDGQLLSHRVADQ